MFIGHVSLLHPHVETATRTLRVRCEVDNPHHELRPGMFATLRFKTPIVDTGAVPLRTGRVPRVGKARCRPNAPESAERDESLATLQKICPVSGDKLGSMGTPIRAVADGHIVLLCCPSCKEKIAARPDILPRAIAQVTDEGVLAIPEQSVIDTGNQTVVYVERKPGVFEGVAVTLGPRAENYIAVIDGVLAGDRVAAAGAFLVDAETRLNPAASATYFGASGSPSKSSPSPSSDSNNATPKQSR